MCVPLQNNVTIATYRYVWVYVQKQHNDASLPACLPTSLPLLLNQYFTSYVKWCEQRQDNNLILMPHHCVQRKCFNGVQICKINSVWKHLSFFQGFCGNWIHILLYWVLRWVDFLGNHWNLQKFIVQSNTYN